MITTNQMIDHLMTIDRLNLGTVKAGQADLWAEVLNEALPDVTAPQAHRALVRLAASRSTEQRGVFLTPADLIDAIRNVSAEDKRERLARLEAAKREHGDFTIDPAVTDPAEFLRFKQTAQTAFNEGASVEQAKAAAWAAIGRTPPQVEEATQKHEIGFEKIGKTL